jgi:hypothetical protein
MGIRTPRQAIKILALLVESGLIYILISVSSAFIQNPGCHNFFLQVTSSVTLFISTFLLISEFASVFLLVAAEVVVYNIFYRIALELY